MLKNTREFFRSILWRLITPIRGRLLTQFAKDDTSLKNLKRSEEQFRLLVAEAQDYAIYMLDPGGLITTWNSGAERIKGYTAQEIIGKHFSCFYRAEDRAAGLPDRVLEIAGKQGKYEEENLRVRKDGST